MTLDEAIKQINERLLDYMDLKGIKITGSSFSCPNKSAHRNGDIHKSAGIFDIGGVKHWKCQGCGAGSDTIAMAAIIEGLPQSGPEFIKITIPKLLDELGIDEPIEISENPIADLYSAIAEQIKIIDEFRGISKETLKEFKVGELKYESACKLAIGMRGISESGFSNNMDLAHDYVMKRVFTNRVVVPIMDRYGRTVAFAGRRKSDDDVSPKWMNSANNGVFQKSKTLYGLNITKKYITETGKVYIVEGYSDLLQLYDKGIKNVVAIMFNSIKKEQVDILRDLKVSSAIVSLDTDPKSSKTQSKSLETGMLLYSNGMSVYIKRIPEVGYDPDSYIRKYGIEKYRKIREVPLIEYAMKEIIDDPNDEHKIDEYLKWLINSGVSSIVVTKALRDLSKYTNLPEDALIDEYDALNIQITEDKDKSIRRTIETISNDLPYLPTRVAVQRLYEAYTDISAKLIKQMASIDRQIDEIDVMVDRMKNPPGLISTGMHKFDMMVKLARHNGTMVVLGGYPNVGKSQLMRQFVYNILKKNDNVSILYYTIDDTKEDVITSMVSHESGISLSRLRYPDKNDKLTAHEEKMLEQGWDWLKSEIANNRLVIAGVDNISTIFVLESVVRNIIRKTNNHVVLCIDSLHSMIVTSLSNMNDMRISAINVSQLIDNMTNRYGLTTIATAELVKQNRLLGKKPTLADISETGKIEYLAKVGIIVHNDLLMNPGTHLYWMRPTGELAGIPLPILEAEILKNKTSYYKGSILMRLDPSCGKIQELNDSEIERLEENKNNSKKRDEDRNKIDLSMF